MVDDGMEEWESVEGIETTAKPVDTVIDTVGAEDENEDEKNAVELDGDGVGMNGCTVDDVVVRYERVVKPADIDDIEDENATENGDVTTEVTDEVEAKTVKDERLNDDVDTMIDKLDEDENATENGDVTTAVSEVTDEVEAKTVKDERLDDDVDNMIDKLDDDEKEVETKVGNDDGLEECDDVATAVDEILDEKREVEAMVGK